MAGPPLDLEVLGLDEDVALCRVCGCSDLEACPEGCIWVPDPEGLGDLCSSCLPEGLA